MTAPTCWCFLPSLTGIWDFNEDFENLRFQWRFWNVVFFFQRISTKIETKSHFQKYWTFLAENPILSKIPFYLEKLSKVWGKSHFHFFLRFCRFSCQYWGKSKFWNLNFEIIISFDKKMQPQCFNENTTAWSSGCVTSTHNIPVKVVNPDFRHVDF